MTDNTGTITLYDKVIEYDTSLEYTAVMGIQQGKFDPRGFEAMASQMGYTQAEFVTKITEMKGYIANAGSLAAGLLNSPLIRGPRINEAGLQNTTNLIDKVIAALSPEDKA